MVEGRLGGGVSGEDMDGKWNLSNLLVGIWVGGDTGMEEDVDNDLVWVRLRKLCCGVLGDFIVLL